jgi:hypothetical protein
MERTQVLAVRYFPPLAGTYALADDAGNILGLKSSAGGTEIEFPIPRRALETAADNLVLQVVSPSQIPAMSALRSRERDEASALPRIVLRLK